MKDPRVKIAKTQMKSSRQTKVKARARTSTPRKKSHPSLWTKISRQIPLHGRKALRPLVLRVPRPRLLRAPRPRQLRVPRPRQLRAPRPRQLRAARRPLHRATHRHLLRLLHNLLRSRLCRTNCKGLTNNSVKSPVCRVADVITGSVLLLGFDRTLLDVCFGQILC